MNERCAWVPGFRGARANYYAGIRACRGRGFVDVDVGQFERLRVGVFFVGRNCGPPVMMALRKHRVIRSSRQR